MTFLVYQSYPRRFRRITIGRVARLFGPDYRQYGTTDHFSVLQCRIRELLRRKRVSDYFDGVPTYVGTPE